MVNPFKKVRQWLDNPRREDKAARERMVQTLVDNQVREKTAQVKEELRASIPIAMLAEQKDVGWRRLTQDNIRDLDPMTRYQQIRVVEYLGIANPLGKWMLDVFVDFVCGKGFTINSKNEELKKLLDDFWFDPAHNLDVNIKRHARNLLQYGEICMPAFVNQYTGRCKLGFVDPMIITDVIGDPANPMLPIGVVLMGRVDGEAVTLRTVLPGEEEDTLSPEAIQRRKSFTAGACFYHAINQPGPSCRGISHMFPIGDWLDGFDTYAWSEMERADLMKSFCWDATLEGFDEDKINAWTQKFPPPRKGEMFAHNEKVKLQAVTPDLKMQDSTEGMRMFLNIILGAWGIPSFWYGGGEHTNRATAAEMDAPAMQGFVGFQNVILGMVYEELDFVIEQALNRRMISESDDMTYTVDTPELATKDIAKVSTALQQITAALGVALSNKLIDSQSASLVFCQFLSLMGTDIDSAAAYAAAQKEKFTEAFEDYQDKPPAGVSVKAAKRAVHSARVGGRRFSRGNRLSMRAAGAEDEPRDEQGRWTQGGEGGGGGGFHGPGAMKGQLSLSRTTTKDGKPAIRVMVTGNVGPVNREKLSALGMTPHPDIANCREKIVTTPEELDSLRGELLRQNIIEGPRK